MLKNFRWQLAAILVLTAGVFGMTEWRSKHHTGNGESATITVSNAIDPSPAPLASELLADLERGLLVASQALLEGRLTDAEISLAQLIRQEPRFRLAHALLADVNRVRAGLGPGTIDTSDSALALQSLREEWRRRLSAPDHLPPPFSWPAGLVAFSPYSRHALVVDANASRLYWLQRIEGEDRAQLVASFFISVGKAGVGKEVEGDNKTPLGVYRIAARRTDADLPSFYGAGALVLDYPNPVDLALRRTGSGIWLHGSPPDTYTRDPLASEGCVVLANTDLRQLLDLSDVIHTPVLIVREVEWLDEATHRRQRDEALALAREWLRTTVGLDPDPQALGLQRWTERDGHRYWRLEYRGNESHEPRMTWFLREADDGLRHVAGPLQMADHHPLKRRQPEVEAGGNPVMDSTGQPNKTERTASTSAAGDNEATHTAVLHAVRTWAQAWSKRDVRRYLAHYHPQFRPEGGLTRPAWEAQRRERIEGKRGIEVEVLQPRVRLDGNSASVTFIQRYRADGQRELRVRKTLVLQREGSRWLIVEERT